jgi:diguanylate cyclase (GGDEF)-like protein
MPQLDPIDVAHLRLCLPSLVAHGARLEAQLASAVTGQRLVPRELEDLQEAVERLHTAFGGDVVFNASIELDDELVPWARAAVELQRADEMAYIERTRNNILNVELLAQLERKLAPFDRIMSQPWYRLGKRQRLPSIADFLTLRQIVQQDLMPRMQPEQFEEKFQILCSSSSILQDLRSYRQQCDMRGSALGVVFLDIDRFKQYNEVHGETHVDTLILPQFFNTLERTVFGHGRAYRHGGDECVLLLPNAPDIVARAIISQVRSSLASAQYPHGIANPTVSIGYIVADQECGLTDRELLDWAARAKAFVKQEGRNAVATYRGDLPTDALPIMVEDLFIPRELRVVPRREAVS